MPERGICAVLQTPTRLGCSMWWLQLPAWHAASGPDVRDWSISDTWCARCTPLVRLDPHRSPWWVNSTLAMPCSQGNHLDDTARGVPAQKQSSAVFLALFTMQGKGIRRLWNSA